MHEPLAVERLSHLLQNLDAPGVVLDQVIVGGEDGGNLALDGEGWQIEFNTIKDCQRQKFGCCTC